MDKKVVLIICDTHLKSDPRVYKQILLFKDKYRIITMGLSKSDLEDEFIKMEFENGILENKNTLKRIYYRFLFFINPGLYGLILSNEFKTNLNKLKKIKTKPVLIVANELIALSYAIEYSKKSIPVHFDAHEYYLNDSNIFRTEDSKRRMAFIYKYYIPKATSFSTVCDSIAEKYKSEFNRNIEVIENVPKYFKLKVKEINHNKIKIIHHGIALPDRQIEKMIDIVKDLPDNYITTFALVKSPKYLDYYEKISNLISKFNNIKLIEGFKMQEIPIYLNEYDIGFYYLEETNLNNKYSLPNKFFEFIQGRLAIITTPNPEMKKYIEKYNIGKTTTNYDVNEMKNLILQLTNEEIVFYKSNSSLCAGILCFENKYKSFFNSIR